MRKGEEERGRWEIGIRRDLLGANLLRRPLPRNLRLLQPEQQNYKVVVKQEVQLGNQHVQKLLINVSILKNMAIDISILIILMRTYTASSHRSGSCSSNYGRSVEVWSANNCKCEICKIIMISLMISLIKISRYLFLSFGC